MSFIFSFPSLKREILNSILQKHTRYEYSAVFSRIFYATFAFKKGPNRSFTVRGLNSSKSYVFRVRGKSKDVENFSPWSVVAQASTNLPAYGDSAYQRFLASCWLRYLNYFAVFISEWESHEGCSRLNLNTVVKTISQDSVQVKSKTPLAIGHSLVFHVILSFNSNHTCYCFS